MMFNIDDDYTMMRVWVVAVLYYDVYAKISSLKNLTLSYADIKGQWTSHNDFDECVKIMSEMFAE